MRVATSEWPLGGIEPVRTCPICGSPSRELVHKDLTDRIFWCAPGTWNMYRCGDCKTGYLDPRPTAGTIGLAYQQYFTHSTQHSPYRSTLLRRLRRALANGYRNVRFGLSLQPASRFGCWLISILPRQRASLDAEGRGLTKQTPRGVLLDVGCGNGDFLDMARGMGWDVHGIDLDPKAVEGARRRGLAVGQGGIETLDHSSDRYDVITLSHVIEHVHNPLALLKSCHRLLKPGGSLWLETPNIDGIGHSTYGRYWRGLEPPRHLTLFTWEGMDDLLVKAGFEGLQPLPWRPVCLNTFSESELAALGADSLKSQILSFRVRWRAWFAEWVALGNLRKREFIGFTARKPL